jgi:mannose-6-phosphate isomerase-like protein (cupin superfamily)
MSGEKVMIKDRRFILMSAEDIRNGIGDSSPGWVMGSFVAAGDLRHCDEFEIKEWDLRTMRRDWRNGEECGPEYIAVLDGTLTIVLGRAGEGQEIVEDREIEVATNQRVILAPGVWRKLKATDDIKGLTVRSKRA